MNFHRPHRPDFRRAVQALLAGAILAVVAACSPEAASTARPASTPTLPPPADAAVAGKGAQVYQDYCAQCHTDGSGSRAMPPLRGSAVVSGPPAGLIQVILKGQRGVSMVNGQKLNAFMPARDDLEDAEVAAVVMHVRRKYASVDQPVSAADVKALR